MAGARAFKEAFMSANLSDPVAFADVNARRMRYAVLWAFYENTAYRDVHLWSQAYRSRYGMYKYSRNIYNPAFRLGSFWQTHLAGGGLDPMAGDGSEIETSLPIITDNQALRDALATGWRNSNWSVRKNIMTLWGSVMGDVGLRVIDDTDRNKVYIDVVHPGSISDITLDAFGNCKAYTLEGIVADPREGKSGTVTYGEVAFRDGDSVVYETYLDGKPYGWNDMPATWDEPYGFIPFVLVKHNDVGLDWGWSELFPALSKVREVDDLASKMSDQVRKMVDSPWLMAGVKKSDITVKGADRSDENPEPGRQEVPMIYAPSGSTATPLVAPLDLAAAAGHVNAILAEIERDFPELQHDIWSAGGDASGRALRVARQRVESKVLMRRTNYDNALVRIFQMMVSIGGYRNYDGFTGFDLDSYGNGDLEMSIGERPVFKADPIDDIEQAQMLWQAVRTAALTGIGPDVFLAHEGWSDEEIAKITASEYYTNWVASQLQLA